MYFDLASLLKQAGFPDSKIVRQNVQEIEDWFSPSLEDMIKFVEGDKFFQDMEEMYVHKVLLKLKEKNG